MRLAGAVHLSKSTIAAYEGGRIVPPIESAALLDAVLESGDALQRLSREMHADRRPWLRDWLVHEQRAALLRAWQPLVLPGLLQTPDYMRLIFESAPVGVGSVDDLVDARCARQRAVLDRDPAPRLFYLISEYALRQGPTDVRREQLSRLIELGRRPNVDIRVVPDGTGTLHGGLAGPVELATMPDGQRVGYADDALRGSVVIEPDDLRGLDIRWEAVSGLALTTAQSESLIARMVDELE